MKNECKKKKKRIQGCDVCRFSSNFLCLDLHLFKFAV